MKIAFLGTPEFALPSLDMLFQSGHELGVFTQPDRPVGRHAVLTPPPTKVYAMKHGIPVFQFEKIRLPEGLEALKSFAPDLMVTAAFGQILSAENLAIPKYGCITFTALCFLSIGELLPSNGQFQHGETETGITTMMTDVGMDTGDILLVDRVAIAKTKPQENCFEQLSVLGAETLRRTIVALEAGTLVRPPQDESQATKCPMLKKEHGKIDFAKTARDVHNLVRGTNPWPGAYALLDGEPLKIHSTHMSENDFGSAQLGSLKGDTKTGLFVRCADGWLEILELQASGSKRMSAKDFVKGHPLDGKVLA